MHAIKLIGLAGLAISGIVFVRSTAGTITVGSTTVKTDFIAQNGKTYVPISDVAKALGMSVVGSNGSFTLSPAGGANQVNGLNGKLGQVLSCGSSTLQVTDIYVGDKYQCKFSTDVFSPSMPTDNVVVVSMRVKNATKSSQMVTVMGGENTSLADSNSHSYGVLDYDGAGGRAPTVLPGAAIDFAIKFSVPKTETPADLVCNLYVYFDGGYKAHQFRISLKKPD